MLRTLRKAGISMLAVFTAVSMLVTTPFIKISAYDGGGSIVAEKDGDKVVIGNDYISREFSTADNKLVTTAITNKRTSGTPLVLVPGEGSEEFIIKRTKNGSEGGNAISLPALNRTGWTAIADSYHNASGASDGPASNLLDGNNSSIWHSAYDGAGQTADESYPHAVNIKMNSAVTFKSFSYTPRQEGEGTNGNVKGYKLYAANSSSQLDWAIDGNGNPTASGWTLVAEGNFKYNGVNPIYVNVKEETTANQLIFVATSSNNGAKFAGGAEFNLHADAVETPKDERSLYSSEFTLNNVEITDTTATINDQEKVGKKVTFSFDPIEFNGVTYTVKENVVMYEGDHFMRKFLEISVPKSQALDAEIDYIDLESLVIDEEYAQWTIPTTAGGIVEMSQFKANLGQPFYVQGMFMGSEFPATDNEIVDGVGYMRYYTGKTFDRLVKDKQAAEVGDNVVYNTWQTVYGAARSTEQDVIQADFFDYIYSIATPSEFRIQYNSWFDEMMYISDESITRTFTEFDKELSKAEVRPLDSYVMDDGWINYNQTVPYDADRIRRAGNTVNTEGFWAFNSKFPNELYPASKLAAKFGSYFGVWVGPRGGYNFYGDIANIIQAAGNGSKAGGSIDVADRVYIKKFTEMACDWQDRFKVNYWKWDGFADNAQYGHFGSAQDGVARYSESNHHMIGGYQNMYHVTDLWEGWIDLMEAVRLNAKENNIYRLWISLTCYTMPSPWFLQWANSVWIQCTADQANTGPSASHMDRQMTYRDAVYYDFLKNHEFQFPLKNIYNHDPVYGVEGTGMHINTATTEQFQNYLYMQATRGSSFWELYFSDSIMTDEKYAVTGEFLEWAETNHHMLSQAKMFGDSPAVNTKLSGNGGGTNNTYGFACFDGVDGIMSVRNPANTEKTITFVYDRNLGVKENTNGKYHIEHSYNFSGSEADKTGEFVYGQEYTITLQPDEVRIFRVSENGDTVAPTIARANTNGSNKITVKFNEKVTGTSFTVNGAPVAATVNDDDVSFTLELANPIPEGDVEVVAVDVKDLAGNACVANTKTIKQNLGKIVVNAAATNLNGAAEIANAEDSLSTDAGFSVKVDVNTTTTGALVAQAGAFELGIDEAGHAYFTVNGATATSEIVVNNGELHTIVGVLENNGMAKIYIDGNVDGAKYNEANRYFETPQAAIVLGNANFAGTLGAKVADEAAGYDNLALNFGVTAREPINPANFTIDVTSIDSENNADPEANPEIIFDGDDQTFWTSAPQDAGLNKDTNMVINLNGTYKIDRVDYTKRFDAGQIFKCTGNLNDIVVEVSMDGETWTEVAAQATFDDESYVAKGDGGTTEISFVPTDASYVRIWANDSYFWDTDSEKEYMTIADLKFYGVSLNPENVALNKTGLIAKYKDGTDAPVNPDRPLSHAVDGSKNNCDANHAGIGSDYDQAGTTSVYFQVDLEDVYSVSSINLFRYWNGGRSYTNTVVAISETEDFANPTIIYNADVNNIHGLGAGTDENYSETSAGKTFNFDAVNGRYVRVYMSGSTAGNTVHIVELEVYGVAAPTSSVDMSALEAKLAEAEAVKTTGYTEASVKVLTDAIAAAKILVARLDATDAEVAAMITRLDDAINGLELPALNEDNLINKAANEATVDSYSSQCGTGGPTENGTGEAFATVDYDPATYWHSNWQLNNGEKHTITYDLGAEYTISDVTFLPRQEGRNGDIHKFEVYVGNNKDYTQNALTGEYVFATSGTLDPTKWYRAFVAGNGDFSGQYVTIRVTGSYGDSGNNQFASMSEIRFYSAEEVVAPEPTVNKDALIEAIDNATAAYENEAGYTPETYQVFKAMYDYAVIVRDNADATQSEVDLAKAALVEKFQALLEVELPDAADKAALNALIAEVEALAEADYSRKSWSNLQAVLTTAKEVAANKAATQDEVDAAKADLEAKKVALVTIAHVREAIAAAEAKLAEADKYTEESVAALQTVVSNAQFVIGSNVGYVQADADMHAENINNAITALQEKAPVVVVVNKAALNALITEVEALTEADYSRKSWSNLQTALTAAKDVFADASATQEVVDQAKAGLEAKKAALVNVVAMREAIAAAEAKLAEAAKYTDETVADLTTAYNAAVFAINSNVGYVQADADLHATNINNAISALVEKPVEPELTAPAKVENLVAEDTNYKTVTLTWDASETATAYDVYVKGYKEDSVFECKQTVEEPTATVSGVMTGKEYSFYVVAKNEAGEAEASETVVKATTLHGKVTLSMKQVSTSKFELKWTAVEGATRYIVYRKRNDDSFKKVLTLGAKDLEYTTAEMPHGNYQFIIKAGRYDSKDRVMTDSSNTVKGKVEELAPVVTLKAGTKSVKVSWKAMEGVTHYQVYRATSKTGKYTKLVTTKDLSYTAKSLTKGKAYYFKVRGYKTYKSGDTIKYNVFTPYSSVKTTKAK